MNRIYRVVRPFLLPVRVLLRLQIGFKDGLQHSHDRRLHDAVRDRRDSQGAHFTVRLRYPDPSDRFRPIVLPP
jgi:hypothetical protein